MQGRGTLQLSRPGGNSCKQEFPSSLFPPSARFLHDVILSVGGLVKNYTSDLYLSCRTIELDLLGIVYVQEILVPDCTVAFPLTAQCCGVIIYLTL